MTREAWTFDCDHRAHAPTVLVDYVLGDDSMEDRAPGPTRSTDRGVGVTRRAPVAAFITVAALAAGGCGTTSPTANLYRIPNITTQALMKQLQQPTSRGPDGYPMLAGPQHLSLGGIEYTTQGSAALQSWLNTPPVKQAAYRQAGRNLAIAFPGSKATIDSKLK